MPLPEQTPVNSSTGNGVTTVFPYTFKILNQADIAVYVDDVLQTLTTHYSVSGVGVDGGGNVTFVSAPANGAVVVRIREMAYDRATDYQENGDLLAQTADDDFDRIVMMAQQLNEKLARAISLKVGTTGVDNVLPDPEASYLIRWNGAANALENLNPASFGYGTDPGRQTLVVPSRAIVPRLTNGPAVGLIEIATNKTMVVTLDFDGATAEYAQFEIPEMPKSWDKNTIIVKFVWSHASGAASYGVRWNVRAKAISDGDSIDTAFGTAQSVSDTGGTADYRYTSAETSAITVGGTPANGDGIVLEIYRDPAHADDTMSTHDARLHGVVVFYSTDTANDA